MDESEYSDDEEFVENVERIELDENSDPESDEGGAEVSFVSNGYTLVGQSPSSESVSKICSRCKGVEKTRKKSGVLVVFDLNPKTGKKYSECRGCKCYTNEIKNPKHNARVCLHLRQTSPMKFHHQLLADSHPLCSSWWRY